MKIYIPALLTFFFLTACATTPTPAPATLTPHPPTATETPNPPTATPTNEPAATPTNTLTPTPIPCDPFEGFCIEEGHFLFERPIGEDGCNQIESAYRYGATQNGAREPHHGVEFINPSGTRVLAAAPGRVIHAAEDKPAIFSPWERFYGNTVVIRHDLSDWDTPLYTLYAHLSRIDVEEGDLVETGQLIGEVGMSGRAIGSHLHFEVRVGKDYTETRNPELWLKLSDENRGAVVVRVRNQNGKLLRVPLMVVRVQNQADAPETIASLEAYAAEAHPVGMDDRWGETHAIADLPAGSYRLSFSYAGGYWERIVEVSPQRVTVVYFGVEE